jgi:hypothetical protein
MVVPFTSVGLATTTPAPLKFTVNGATKPVPVRVTGTIVLWTPLVGLTDASVGTAKTVNVTVVEVVVPPGVVTETVCGPAGAFAATWKVDVIIVLLTSVTLVGETPVPLRLMTGETKLVPVRVTLTLFPWMPLVGLIEASVGSGGLIVNVCVPEVPPAVVTDTVRAPRVALAAITNVAVSVVPLGTTFVTVTPVPLTATVAPATRFVPVSVTGTLALSAPNVGLIIVSVGDGGSTVNVWLPVVPLAVVTLTFCAPSVAVAATVNVAVIVVLLVTVVPETAIPTPAGTLMVLAPMTKFVPVSVTGTALPCTPLVGLIEVSVGGGGLTVNVSVLEVPPAVVTLTVCAPSAAVADI